MKLFTTYTSANRDNELRPAEKDLPNSNNKGFPKTMRISANGSTATNISRAALVTVRWSSLFRPPACKRAKSGATTETTEVINRSAVAASASAAE